MLLAPFDRIVIATGAAYPLGLGPLRDDDARSRRRPLAGRVAGRCRSRRCATGSTIARGTPTGEQLHAGLRSPGQIVIVIGDAAKPGKSKEAIASAFEAALLGN